MHQKMDSRKMDETKIAGGVTLLCISPLDWLECRFRFAGCSYNVSNLEGFMPSSHSISGWHIDGLLVRKSAVNWA